MGQLIHSDPHTLPCLYFLKGSAGIFFDHTAQGRWGVPDLCSQFVKSSDIIMLRQVSAYHHHQDIALPAFIIKRLPVRLTFDNNYFNALYQGIPIGGYTKLVEHLLEGIEVRLNTDYLEQKEELDKLAETVVYTGPIDAYFGYSLGALEYRSVRFETEVLDIPNFQGNAAVNYTDRETPWTRIIEHKWFEIGHV